jgi:hypothetical protein
VQVRDLLSGVGERARLGISLDGPSGFLAFEMLEIEQAFNFEHSRLLIERCDGDRVAKLPATEVSGVTKFSKSKILRGATIKIVAGTVGEVSGHVRDVVTNPSTSM